MAFYNEPGFWVFLTTFIGSIRWLARVFYLYKQRNLMVKAKFDSTIEKLKSDNIAKAIEGLNVTVEKIQSIIQIHEVKMGTLEVSLKNIESLERSLTLNTDNLKSSYDDFNRIIPKIAASGQLLLDRVQKIETEILKFQNGDIFVRTKK